MKEDVIMRVISGKYKGKKIDGFDIEGTRPTQDRVKESLFGIIQNYLIDSVCLDLFAGSGNLGIEALSNGANSCVFVDNNINAIKVLKDNLKDINDVNEKTPLVTRFKNGVVVSEIKDIKKEIKE